MDKISDEQKKEIQLSLSKINKISGLQLEIDTDKIIDADNTLKELSQIYDLYSLNSSADILLKKIILGEENFSNLEDRLSKLNIKNNISRCFFLIKAPIKIDDIIIDILSELLSSSKNIFIKLNRDKILILHTISNNEDENKVRDLAHEISDIINTEAMQKINVCYGKKFDLLEELQDRFRDISLAMEISYIFYSHKQIISEKDLGIAPLIYSLPLDICKKFLKDNFKTEAYVDIDKEIMQTINIFFLNNLNIAETSRQLHMHRNTLVYRLEQIEAKTGIEIRSFEGAMKFNIASMLINYLRQRGENL